MTTKERVKLEKELKSDIEWLRIKARRLVDSLVLTQDKITKARWRLEKLQRSNN